MKKSTPIKSPKRSKTPNAQAKPKQRKGWNKPKKLEQDFVQKEINNLNANLRDDLSDNEVTDRTEATEMDQDALHFERMLSCMAMDIQNLD